MCSPGKQLTREEFATFLLTAHKYNLNPLMREIYALPKKGGGIIPTVSIDGWMHLANAHPAFDGMEFTSDVDNEGKPYSTTCIIYRKDRNHPIALTELFSECVRETDPWRSMPHRMLRHKAAIQATRYAFGFAGIYDEDEAARFTQPPARDAPLRITTAQRLDEIANCGNATTTEPSHDPQTGEIHEDWYPGPEAPKPVAEMTADEAAAELAARLEERAKIVQTDGFAGSLEEGYQSALKALMDKANDQAKSGGAAAFKKWHARLNAVDADMLAPYVDSYRQQATYADETRAQ
jgi:phage recombination protein Bet